MAARLETDGWDGVMVFDSQNLLTDPYVALTLASTSTERLGLGIGVSNTVTRHPAVTAAALVSLHQASNGRAVIGIGRGNSAMFNIGAGPARLAEFEQQVSQLKRYVRGEAVPADELAALAGAETLEQVTKGHAPEASRLTWVDPDASPPVIEVAATGPKVMGIGARLGDRVSVSVGANLDRLAWAAEVVRGSVPAGRPAPSLSAYVSVVAHPDVELARRLAAPEVAMHTHILGMMRSASFPASEADRTIIDRVTSGYDMTRHGDFGPQTEALTDGFIDDNAVVGDPSTCIDKLSAIAGLGYDRIIFMLPLRAAGQVGGIMTAMRDSVLPALAPG